MAILPPGAYVPPANPETGIAHPDDLVTYTVIRWSMVFRSAIREIHNWYFDAVHSHNINPPTGQTGKGIKKRQYYWPRSRTV